MILEQREEFSDGAGKAKYCLEWRSMVVLGTHSPEIPLPSAR